MKNKGHIFFSTFIVLLLFAPKTPIGHLSFVPARSSINMAVFVLIAWFLSSFKKETLKLFYPVESILLCTFAIFTLFPSVMSGKQISIAYSGQYIIYSILLVPLINQYLNDVIRKNELTITIYILTSIAVIYSIGVIISEFTGPIYPSQIHYYWKAIDGIIIRRGTGFSEGANTAGGVLMAFLSLLFFQKIRFYVIIKVILFIGLFITYSRASMIGFLLATNTLWAIEAVYAYLKRKECKKRLIKVLIIPSCVAVIYCIAPFISNQPYVETVFELYGFRGKGIVYQAEKGRVEHWNKGIDCLKNNSFSEKLIGKGFRRSSTITDYGTWTTPHNLYIAILADFGIIGILLFGAFTVYYLLFSLRGLTNSYKVINEDIFRGSFCAILSILAINLTEVYLYSPIFLFLLIFLLSLQNIVKLKKQGASQEAFSL
jgi:hypothetical protein